VPLPLGQQRVDHRARVVDGHYPAQHRLAGLGVHLDHRHVRPEREGGALRPNTARVSPAANPHLALPAVGAAVYLVQAVQRYVRPLRAMTAAAPRTRWSRQPPDHPSAAVPSGHLDDEDQARIASIQDRCPHLNALAAHVRSFAEMMTRRQDQQELEGCPTRVEADDQPGPRSFAAGIRRDQQAVTAGLTLPYSPAAVAGNVTRKMLKRQMYVRPIRPATQTCHPSLRITPITEFAPRAPKRPGSTRCGDATPSGFTGTTPARLMNREPSGRSGKEPGDLWNPRPQPYPKSRSTTWHGGQPRTATSLRE
jgi:hypothetical protein